MRAGKRLDPFPNSYTGDPLAAYRLNIAKAGYPNWMMLYGDSGPMPVDWVEPEPKELEGEDAPPTAPVHEEDKPNEEEKSKPHHETHKNRK
jgi:hypothetical protein